MRVVDVGVCEDRVMYGGVRGERGDDILPPITCGFMTTHVLHIRSL